MVPELGESLGLGTVGGTWAKTTTLKHAAAAANSLLIPIIFPLAPLDRVPGFAPAVRSSPPAYAGRLGKPNRVFLDNYVTFLLDSTCPNQA